MTEFDVAIVGCGPVGAMAANLCGHYGLRTLIIDRSAEIYALPRAVAFDHETMRIVQNIGLAPRLTPHIAPYAPTNYHGVDGRIISRFDFAPPPYPLGWAPNYVFRQPIFEADLRAGLASHATVSARLDLELVGLDESHTAVTLTCRDQDNLPQAIRAKYLLGADGGGSLIRRLLGVEMESLDFDQPWLVVDVLCTDATAARLPTNIIQFCNPARPMTYVLGTGTHRRWEIMLLPGETPEQMTTEENIWRLLAPWIAPGDAVLWRYAAYRFHALVANRWRVGRTILIGDAAHMTPPFLAQGMVQGMRDCANLTWKLARVLKGLSSSALLDSYERERAPHVRATTATAKSFGQVICELDGEKARARDAKLLAEFGDPPRVRFRQSLIPGLTTGIIDVSTPGAGSLFPQPFVIDASGQRQLLDDVAGWGLRLVICGLGANIIDDSSRRALAAIGGCVVVIRNTLVQHDANEFTYSTAIETFVCAEADDVLARWFAAHHCRAALVRPDHYVYGTATDALGVTRLCTEFAGAIG